MTVAHDPAECQRLVADARDHANNRIAGLSDPDDWISAARACLRALANQLEAACALAEARRKALARELEENQPAMTDLIAKLEAECDSLRDEVAQLKADYKTRGEHVLDQRRIAELEAEVVRAEIANASLIPDAIVAVTGVECTRVERDALKAKVAELEADIEGWMSTCSTGEYTIRRLIKERNEARDTLRTILPVYRAAEAWRLAVSALESVFGRRSDRWALPANNLSDSIDTASSAITPEIDRLLAEMDGG